MRVLLAGIAAAVIGATVLSHAQSPQFDPSDDETRSLWFVELTSPPTTEGTATEALVQEEDAFHAAAEGAGVQYTETRHFRDLFNGLTVSATDAEVNKLRGISGVQAVFPVLAMSMQQDLTQSEDTPDTTTDLITALKQTGADIAQNSLGLSGAGIKVAVIDSGIDYQHPDLGGCFGTGCRVAGGYDLVGDAYNADNAVPIIVPDALPDDCNGHGTHVAGIVGANGGIKGVAPGVTFLAYRVFGCTGATSTDVLLAAMERAKNDGADIINMSVGAALQWPQYPTAKAADRLVRLGIVVVASAGNDSGLGLYGSSAPSVGKRVLGVASFENTHANLVSFTEGANNLQVGYATATAAPIAPVTGSTTMMRALLGQVKQRILPASPLTFQTRWAAQSDEGCSPLPLASQASLPLLNSNPAQPLTAARQVVGKVVLVKRGTCSFYQKALNAQLAGAIGVVIYNNVPGFITPTVAPQALTAPYCPTAAACLLTGSTSLGGFPQPSTLPAITIPVVAVTQDKGALMVAGLPTDISTAPMTWTSSVSSEPNPNANLISSFSSWGPSPDLSLKPDLGAPGGSVRSTVPIEQGSYGLQSGTSMAAPHVAGAVALLLEARPHTRPEEVQERLQNTALPELYSGNTALGLDAVHRQGAGMLQIDDAITAPVVVSPSRLSLGEIETGSVTRWLEIEPSRTPEVHEAHEVPETPEAPEVEHSDKGDNKGDNKKGDSDKDHGKSDHDKDHHVRAPGVTYTLGHVPAMATGADTFAPQALASFATVQFAKPSVVVGGGEQEDVKVKVTITPPAASTGARLFGGYITLTPSDGGTVLRVPYLGYTGDYQAIPVFTLSGFPMLARRTSTSFLPQPAGGLFTMTAGDVPYILFHLNHQVRNMKMQVVDVTTGLPLDFANIQEYVGRNSASNTFFSFGWDGTTTTEIGGAVSTLPNGTYRLDVSVLKAKGDPNNPAHYELWSSPNITIARPTP